MAMTDKEITDLKKRCIEVMGTGATIARHAEYLLDLITEVEGHRKGQEPKPKATAKPVTPKEEPGKVEASRQVTSKEEPDEVVKDILSSLGPEKVEEPKKGRPSGKKSE